MTYADAVFRNALSTFVEAMRTLFARQLQAAFGEDWWTRGVLATLDRHREYLQRRREESNLDPSQLHRLLEIQHFLPLLRSHYSDAFANTFPDYSRTGADLAAINRLRNKWAHLEQLNAEEEIRCVRTMRDLLARAGMSAASDLDRILNTQPAAEQPSAALEAPAREPATASVTGEEKPMKEETVNEAELEEPDTVEVNRPASDDWMADLWRHVQRLLSLSVEVRDIGGPPGRPQSAVVVTVTNRAPANPDYPECRFNRIQLETSKVESLHRQPLQGESRPMPDGATLRNGETRTWEFVAPSDALLPLEFSLSANFDYEAYFKTAVSLPVPAVYVQPLAASYIKDFQATGVTTLLAQVSGLVQSLGPDTTIKQVANIRQSLASAQERITAVTQQLQALFQKYHLTEGTRTGDHARAGSRFLYGIMEAVKKLDQAMATTDPSTIGASVEALKRLDADRLNLESATRELASRFGVEDEEHSIVRTP